jgi:WD repeat-containing protein 55
VTDLRKGVITRSENQEEELVSSVYIGGLASGGTSRGEKLIVGGAGGVLTLWEKGAWDDQDERIYVDRGPRGGEALESLAVVPDDLGMGKMIVVGQGDGSIAIVKMGINKVISTGTHDEMEGVTHLGFDVEGRMVSGGGQVVKVWHEARSSEDIDEQAAHKRILDSGSDEDSEEEKYQHDSDEEREGGKRRRKRKRGKGKDRSGGRHLTALFKGLD